jgi:hypothetical protein
VPRQLRLNDTQLADFEEVKFSQVNPEQPHKMSMETSHYEYSNFFQPARVQDAFETKAKDERAQSLVSDQEEEKSFSVDSDENSECQNEDLNDLDATSNEFELAQDSDESLTVFKKELSKLKFAINFDSCAFTAPKLEDISRQEENLTRLMDLKEVLVTNNVK